MAEAGKGGLHGTVAGSAGTWTQGGGAGFVGVGGFSWAGGTGYGGAPIHPPNVGGSEPIAPDCPDRSLGSALPVTATGTTVGQRDSFQQTCGADSGSGEFTFAWTPPHTGSFRFDTTGSTFDTILSLVDGYCDPYGHIACNDDGPTGTTSSIVSYLDAGQGITVVVGGFGGAEGEFTLTISQANTDCPDATLSLGSGLPGRTDLGTADDSFMPSCGAPTPGSPDFSAVFVAPWTGSFSFDTLGSNFDTVLEALDGACEGNRLGCSDDSELGDSRIVLTLTENQLITLIVDGFAGDQGSFTLRAQSVNTHPCCQVNGSPGGCVPADVAECVCSTLPGCCTDSWSQACVDAVQSTGCGSCRSCIDAVMSPPPSSLGGTTVGLSDRVTAEACGARAGSGDYSALFTAPRSSLYRFDTRGSSFDTVLSMVGGNGCWGPDRGCNDDGQMDATSELTTYVEAGEMVTLTVDGYSGDYGHFLLNVIDVGVE